MEYPKRKLLRLPEYDYSAPGAYFVTICSYDRRCILSNIAVGALHEAPAAAIQLTRAGFVVQQVLENLHQRYSEIKVDHSVIMPNHVHLLLRIEEKRALREAPLRPEGKRSLLSQAVGYLKMNSSKQIHAFSPALIVWQRGYHEHVVRGEKDLLEIWDYIENNPAKWAEDRYYAE